MNLSESENFRLDKQANSSIHRKTTNGKYTFMSLSVIEKYKLYSQKILFRK